MDDGVELAEMLWEVADPFLTDAQRSEMCVALNISDPVQVVLAAVRTLVSHREPVPRGLFDRFQSWLDASPPLKPDDPMMPAWIALHVLKGDLTGTDSGADPKRYGHPPLCHFILDEAGAVDANHDRQAQVLGDWLTSNRPSPSLRADLVATGFGHLLADHQERRQP